MITVPLFLETMKKRIELIAEKEGKLALLNKNLISEFRLNSLLNKRYYFDKKTFEYINYHKDKVFLR
jgi:hypothetical protein